MPYDRSANGIKDVHETPTMRSAKAQDEMDRQAVFTLMESIRQTIREHLEKERQRIYEEIKHYPTPIPACDAQFNYLLEQRTGIGQELDRLKALSNEACTREDDVKMIDEFIMSSDYLKGESEQRIRSSLLSVLQGAAQEHI